MIDINSLRRLAQAATKGPWVSQGRYIGTPSHMSYIGEVRDQCGNWSDTEKSRSDAAYIAAANPTTINELLNRIEAAESDAVEQARLNGMGASREAALMAKLEAAEKDRDELRARIEAMEKQEPVAWMYDDGTSHKFIEPVLSVKRKDFPDGWRDSPLYAAPIDAKAIRAEALKEAAKVCRTAQAQGLQSIREAIEEAIRGLKEES